MENTSGDRRFDTLRVNLPTLNPQALAEVLDEIRKAPGLEGVVRIVPDTPGAEVYRVVSDFELPGAAGLPEAEREKAEKNIALALFAHVSERDGRYVVKFVPRNDNYEYCADDLSAMNPLVRKVRDVVMKRASYDSPQD